MMNEKKGVVLFDGVCNLCNGFVNFIIQRDKNDFFRFTPLQSGTARELLAKYEITEQFKTVILIEDGRVFTRSTAALRIFRRLNGFWPLLCGFFIVPTFLRNWIYRMIAKYRYNWFGKKDECMIPTPEVRSKFLEYDNE